MIMKKALPQITLIGVTCKDLAELKTAAGICEKYFSFGAVKILSSIKDDDPRIIPIPHYNTIRDYNDFVIKELCRYVDTTHIIHFHPDGFILNPDAWTDEFLEYDYIGAPWYRPGSPEMGNGGFSLRSKRLLKLVAENWQTIGGETFPEDQWLCVTARPFLEEKGMKFAPLEIASRWAKEGNARGVVWDGQFGWHGLVYTDISKWLDKNPEYKAKIGQKLNDFTRFMRKYPIYDGTVHVLHCKPIQVENYRKLSRGEKNYDCRLDLDLSELDKIQPGHAVIYTLFRISPEKVGVPTFERRVAGIEKFRSKKELLAKHPKIEITNSFHIPKWRQRFAAIFGNMVYPENEPYSLLWFEGK